MVLALDRVEALVASVFALVASVFALVLVVSQGAVGVVLIVVDDDGATVDDDGASVVGVVGTVGTVVVVVGTVGTVVVVVGTVGSVVVVVGTVVSVAVVVGTAVDVVSDVADGDTVVSVGPGSESLHVACITPLAVSQSGYSTLQARTQMLLSHTSRSTLTGPRSFSTRADRFCGRTQVHLHSIPEPLAEAKLTQQSATRIADKIVTIFILNCVCVCECRSQSRKYLKNREC